MIKDMTENITVHCRVVLPAMDEIPTEDYNDYTGDIVWIEKLY